MQFSINEASENYINTAEQELFEYYDVDHNLFYSSSNYCQTAVC